MDGQEGLKEKIIENKNEIKIEQPCLQFLNLIKEPTKEKLKSFIENFEALRQKTREINQGDKEIDFGDLGDVALFFFDSIPQNREELETMIKKSLGDKTVLEIGAGQLPHKIFQKYAKDYYVAERKGYFKDESNAEQKGTVEDFYHERRIKLFPMLPPGYDKIEIPAVDFDILCSTHIWWDGDCGSYAGFRDGGWEAFEQYHKYLKKGGAIYSLKYPTLIDNF